MIKLAIVGDVLVDYTLIQHGEDKMRHGGIIHAARGAWSLDTEYALFYFTPSYLERSIVDFAKSHHARLAKIGTVGGCPNLILIKEAKEIAHQGYELILRNEKHYDYNLEPLAFAVSENQFTDYLVFSGGFDLEAILQLVSRTSFRLHLDLANDISDFKILASLPKKLTSLYLSTSSTLFLKTCGGDVSRLVAEVRPYTESLIFKENRGGSRFFDFTAEPLHIPSQTRPVVHSVGVGDVYNVAHIWASQQWPQKDALHFASWIAAEYASTTFVDNFKQGVQRTLQIGVEILQSFGGIFLPWEKRKGLQIYIAAPDFNYINTEPIRQVEEVLAYHNFAARLPIREHGQLTANSTHLEREQTCNRDIELLDQCELVVGILLFNDPGTLLELGYAIAKGKPTIVYDPFHTVKNCILEFLPTFVSSNLDEIVSTIFSQANQLNK